MEPRPQPPLLEVEQAGGVTVARFACRRLREDATLEAVGRQLHALLEGGEPPRLVLNFAEVDDLGSALLARLVGLHKRAKAAGGRLALCALAPEILVVFETTWLDRMFHIYPGEPEALRSFAEGEP